MARDDRADIGMDLAALHQETLAQWIIRFHRERGQPEPTEVEVAELIRLNDIDEASAHQ